MVESILFNVVVLALLGVVYKQFTSRQDRIESKVDWLITRNGGGYQAKQIKERGDGNGPSNKTTQA